MDEIPEVTIESPTEWWKVLEKLGLPQPVLPPAMIPWKEAFVGNLSKESPKEPVYRAPPLPPMREVPTEYADDEDGEWVPVEWRMLSDDEWEAALAAHRKDHAAWMETGGLLGFRQSGPTFYEFKLTYEKHGLKIGVDYAMTEGDSVWFLRGSIFQKERAV